MLIVFLGITALFNTAHADSEKQQWNFFQGSIPILSPSEGSASKVYLMVGAQGMKVSILSVLGPDSQISSCQEGETSDNFVDIAPISINNTFYKFVKICLNGTAVMQPKTTKGKQVFNSLVLSGNPVTVDFNNGMVLHYPSSDVETLKNKLAAMSNAQ